MYPFNSPEKIGTVLFGGNEIVTYIAYMFILEIKQGDTFSVEEYTKENLLNKRIKELYAAHKNNDWFMFYDQIIKLKNKIEGWPRYKNQKEKKTYGRTIEIFRKIQTGDYHHFRNT